MKYQMTPVLSPAEKRAVRDAEKLRDQIEQLEAQREQVIERMGKQGLPARMISRATGIGHNAITRRLKKSKRANH